MIYLLKKATWAIEFIQVTIMKSKFLPCLLLLGLATYAEAQSASSDPVGFVTLSLQQGNNYVGFSLMSQRAYQGAFTVETSNRARLYLTNATLTNDQFNPPVISAGSQPTHIIEVIGDGATQGLNTAIMDTVATGSEIVLQEPLHPGVGSGGQLKIWKLWTIGDAFGPTNSAGLTSANTSNTSDIVLIPNGAGYDQYYYSAGGFSGAGWRKVGAGATDQKGVPLYYTDGFMILARSAKTINIVGSVKPGQTTVVLETGNNFLANLCPVNAGGDNPSTIGRTLGNSNLYNGTANGLAGGNSVAAADLVLIGNGAGFDQFFYSTGGFVGTGWRQVGGGATDMAGKPLPDGAFIVFRRGAPTTVSLSQPSF